MLAITQFEVLVLQKGRWILHARYPGEERKEAVYDAQATENATGFPAKVVRETYFPEINESERITTYVSPRAKSAPEIPTANQRRRPTVATARPASAAARRPTQAPPRVLTPRLTALQVFFRVIVASGVSLAAATLTTAIFAWGLQRFAEAGVDIGPGTRTTLLTYSYVVMFLVFFYRLFRSKLLLHRLLADLWTRTSAQAKAVTALALPRDAKLPKVVPKHARGPSPEEMRQVEDLKVKRGDLDAAPPPVLTEAGSAAREAPIPAPAPVQPREDELAAQRAVAARAAEAKAKRLADDKKAEEARKAKEASSAAENAAASQAAEAAAAAALRESINLERMVMRRFAIDVVKAAVALTMPDDPVARRGAAIVLAGGAAGVAATARLNAMAEQELLSDALHHIGMHAGAIEPFMAQRPALTTLPVNSMLLAAGRSALGAYLDGAPNVAASLARVLSNWRTPVGQAQEFTTNPALVPVPLVDVYLLTELREDGPAPGGDSAADNIHDQHMGTHNGVVRAALAAHGGHEVKHTGKGIFARFPDARAAVDASVGMQNAFAAQGAQLAIGIIGNTVAGEDPLLTANLVRQAQAILARTGAGETLAEAQVHAAVRETLPPAVLHDALAPGGPLGAHTGADHGLAPPSEPAFETGPSAARI